LDFLEFLNVLDVLEFIEIPAILEILELQELSDTPGNLWEKMKRGKKTLLFAFFECEVMDFPILH
jgi:hypothetical protein